MLSHARSRRLIITPQALSRGIELRWGAALVLLIVATGCSSAIDRAARERDVAQQLVAQGNPFGARMHFDAAVALRDDQPELWIARARNQVALDDYSGALGSYSAALDLDRTNREALDAVGQIALLAGNYDQADRVAEQTLTLAPDDPTALFIRGSIELERGRLDAATATLDGALRQNPQDENLLILQSRLFDRRGDLVAARRVLTPLIVARSVNPLFLEQLSRLDERDFDGRRLVRTLAQAAQTRPDNVAVRMRLAQQLLTVGQVHDALRILALSTPTAARAAVETTPLEVIAASDVDPAKLAIVARQQTPLSLNLRLACVRHALFNRRLDLARTVLLTTPRALRSGEWQAMVAYLLSLARQNDDARKLADAQLAADPRATFALLARAQTGLRHDSTDEALRDVRLAASDTPRAPEPVEALADVFRARDEVTASDFALVDAFNRNRDNVMLLRLLVERRSTTANWTDLRPLVRNFTLRNPANVAGWRLRRDLCARVGDTPCRVRAAAIIRNLTGTPTVVPLAPPEERPTDPGFVAG